MFSCFLFNRNKHIIYSQDNKYNYCIIVTQCVYLILSIELVWCHIWYSFLWFYFLSPMEMNQVFNLLLCIRYFLFLTGNVSTSSNTSCSEGYMASSISSDNNSSQCVLSQTQTYTVHSSQVDVTTISPLSKTSTTIYYESSSLSQVTYSTTPPIVDVSSTSTIIAISVTAVLMVSIILITLFLAIIVLRRYGHFKPGRW